MNMKNVKIRYKLWLQHLTNKIIVGGTNDNFNR